jgi:7,8-dihydroneopterin aldolase/epimerase/oxygenase
MNSPRSMDKLRVTGLALSALIGVHAWERRVRQPILVDLEFDTDAPRAAAYDDLAQAHDYGAVARRVTELVGRSEFNLIETLAERIAQCVLAEFGVARIKVVVHKPNAVPTALDTSIEIERKS